MSLPDRIRAATSDRDIVIGADGLLAEFNDAGILAPLDVMSASAIGRMRSEEDQEVLLATALAVRGTRFGHVCIRLASQQEAVFVDGLEGVATDALSWPSPDAWEATIAVSPLLGDGGEDTPLVLVDDRLYLQRYHAYEVLVAGFITDRIGSETDVLDPSISGFLDVALPSSDGPGLTRQRIAAGTALSERFAVIAGGPGTGKTHTIAAMLLALAQSDEPFPLVALGAPTGKAAARLGEALTDEAERTDKNGELLHGETARERLLGVEGSTIHRLLGYHPARGRFLHNRDNRLPHDLVIIDEMSMVSLPLAARLLSAVRDDATVVLVGDPYQLESIEAGTVLADIVGPAGSDEPERLVSVEPPIAKHVVVLDRVHRYAEGGEIADFAGAVRTGDADEAINLLSAGSNELDWIHGESGTQFDALVEQITEHRTNLVELARTPGSTGEALAALDGLAVLCAHHRGPRSVDQWRHVIEAALDETYPGLRFGAEWYPGQPVMITTNDYRLNLFNGDIGVTVETYEGPKVVFARGGIRMFPRSHIGDHTTVHAMTIHKSQGSQFDEVVVALPAESSRLLTRELLYTAVTRASEKVTLVGDEAVIRHAISRSVERASGLGVRLWGSGS
ncbi:MAG: exodeoxyribonuclease V subunit alpha [Actinomycetota bacterium]|nr:exodeoxyribonuclease V subunit alpha [Actinomycetota bacterium]